MTPCLCGHPESSHPEGECDETGCPCVGFMPAMTPDEQYVAAWRASREPTPPLVVGCPLVVTGQMVVDRFTMLPDGSVVPDPRYYPWLYESEVLP